jgi:hypothetical protein
MAQLYRTVRFLATGAKFYQKLQDLCHAKLMTNVTSRHRHLAKMIYGLSISQKNHAKRVWTRLTNIIFSDRK